MERPHRSRPSRAGFTLVELLVVILVIGILLALLVPAVAGAFKRAKEAQVTAEMTNLATALASFRTAYGDYPPSRILLCERGYSAFLATTNTNADTVIPDGGSGAGSDMTYRQLAQRSLTYMRKFWPRADFMTAPPTTPALGKFNDFNGDRLADPTNMIILSGSECLTFFLGGIPINDGTGNITGVSGFSKSPLFPFVDSGSANGVPLAPNRTVPNYEFANGRLVDLDGDGVPSYVDPLDVNAANRRPYAYFSAYGSNAYDPNDVNGNSLTSDPVFERGEDETTFIERGFTVAFPVASATGTSRPFATSPAPNPYTSSVPVGNNPAWINANSFQIISAGQDRLWGLGGTYTQASTSGAGKLPILPIAKDAGNLHTDDTTGVRGRENDNLTNFSGGRLE